MEKQIVSAAREIPGMSARELAVFIGTRANETFNKSLDDLVLTKMIVPVRKNNKCVYYAV